MKLNKATSHALRLLLTCANAGNRLQKVADLAADLELTQQNTFKIVHLLSRIGFLKGERGRYGGVRLRVPADAIRVGDVVKAMELLPARSGESGRETRSHKQLFDDAFEAFIAVLNQTTVADMSRGQQSMRPPKPRSANGTRRGGEAQQAAQPRGVARTSS